MGRSALWIGCAICALLAACARPEPESTAASSCVIKSGDPPECACTADDVCIAMHPRVFTETFGEADGARPTVKQLRKLRSNAARRREPLRHELLSVADACEIAGERCVLIKERD